MTAVLQLALEPVLSLFFPTRCVACSRRAPRALCDACHHAMEYMAGPACARCDQPLGGRGNECADCRRLGRPAFERVLAVGPYRGSLKSAVHALKYRDGWRVADVLAEAMVARVRAAGWAVDAVVPVPIDARRRAARGYSQSEVLASRVAVRLSRPHRRRLLLRAVEGVVQSTANVAQRHAQVAGIFEVAGAVRDSVVLLVDDVMTTAATMQAAAAALKARGAVVYGVVVARQTLRQAPRRRGETIVEVGGRA